MGEIFIDPTFIEISWLNFHGLLMSIFGLPDCSFVLLFGGTKSNCRDAILGETLLCKRDINNLHTRILYIEL